jgi:hypothetical protein
MILEVFFYLWVFGLTVMLGGTRLAKTGLSFRRRARCRALAWFGMLLMAAAPIAALVVRLGQMAEGK